MFLPQNVPPPPDLPDLPRYPVSGLPAQPIVRTFVLNRAQALMIYAVCGALAGVVAGVGAIPIHYAFYRWDLHELDVAISFPGVRLYTPKPPKMSDLRAQALILGSVLGILCGAFMWLIACLWSAARHPYAAAVLCPSLAGSVLLVMVAREHLGHFIDRDQLLLGFAVLASVMLLGAVFGFAQAVLVGRAVRWIEHRHSRVNTHEGA